MTVYMYRIKIFIWLIPYLICNYVMFSWFMIKLFTAHFLVLSALFSPQGGSIRLWLQDQMQIKANA